MNLAQLDSYFHGLGLNRPTHSNLSHLQFQVEYRNEKLISNSEKQMNWNEILKYGLRNVKPDRVLWKVAYDPMQDATMRYVRSD
jgi:hypothetical protein